MKKTTILFAASLMAAVASASTIHNLQGVDFRVDTLTHYPIGPGAVYTELRYQSLASAGKHFTANVLEYDLTGAKESGLDFRMHLGRDSVHTSERMTDVAARHADENNHYLAAINGDFFITWSSTPGMLGYPNNTACSDGQMALSDNVDNFNHVDAWVMDRDFGMWCDQTVLSNKLILSDNTTKFNIYGVNFARRDDARRDPEDDSQDIVFYNEHRGRYTGSPAGWKEVPVVLADGAKWQINKSVKMLIAGPVSTTGHMAIPRNGGVIACAPNAPLDLSTLAEGDWVKLKLNLSLPTFDNLKPDVKEVVGGDVTLLRNGQAVFEANRFINARDSEYPRTMVGYDAGRTKMVWCTVDGKSNLNTGCSYPQGADIMKALGCLDAINFDGGGSTMMWTDKAGIVNRPSDGSERAVGNGLFAVLQRPTDNAIASIRFRDWAKTMPQYGQYTPVVYGYNQYGQLVDTDVQGVALTCSPALGTIDEGGTTLLAQGTGMHALTASLGDLSASIAIDVVQASEVEFNVTDMLIDNIRTWDIETFAKIGTELMPLGPQALTWASDNPAVAQVDAAGRVKGLADGTASINATVGDFSGTVNVTVECPVAAAADLQNPVDADAWTTTANGLRTHTVAAEGPEALRIDFTLSSPRGPKVTLSPKSDMRMWSLPQAVEVAFTPTGDVTVSTLTLTVKPADDRNKTIRTENITHGASNVLTFSLADAFDIDVATSWPAMFKSLVFALSGSSGAAGSIRIDAIRLLYPQFSGIVPPAVAAPEDSDAPVEYYNLQGMRVAQPGAGLYIRRQGAKAAKVLIR